MSRLFLVTTALLALTAGTASAARDRSVDAPAEVTGLARSGLFVAFAVASQPRDCAHVRIWGLASRAVHRLGAPRPCGPVTSTGRGLLGPVVGGNRALWVTYVGGNVREWSLWTATTTARSPRRLGLAARDVDATGPFVLGDGSATMLPYAVDDRVIVLRPSGARRFAWQAPSRVVALDASSERVVVLLADGDVVQLRGDGAVIATEPFAPGEVRAVRAAVGGRVVQHGRTVELRRGGERHVQTLPARARLLDYAEGVALYGAGGELRGRRLTTGADRRLRSGTLGALEHNGLSYALGRRVASVARVRLGV